MNIVPGERSTRVLYLRSYSRAPFAAAWAGGLILARDVEFWQFPPWPEEAYAGLAKLPDANDAEKALRLNLLTEVEEVEERLMRGDFDLVILSDEDGQFINFSGEGSFAKARMIVGAVLGSLGPENARAHAAYAKSMRLSIADIASRVPLAVVDLADTPFVTPASQHFLQLSTRYFKRELPFDRLFMYYMQRPTPWTERREELVKVVAKARGIPLGLSDVRYASLKELRSPEKDIDVLMVGSITNTMRITAVAKLRSWAAGRGWNVEIHDSLPYSSYIHIMARSKVTVSVAGGGWDCFRHCEAVALGSVPLMNRPTVDAVWWHNMPEDVFFENTFSNFGTRLECLVANQMRRERCLELLTQHVENHALHSRMIEYIVRETMAAESVKPFTKKQGVQVCE